jgi:hypothetical protein
MSLQIAAGFHGFPHSNLVGVFEIGADGEADADSCRAIHNCLTTF